MRGAQAIVTERGQGAGERLPVGPWVRKVWAAPFANFDWRWLGEGEMGGEERVCG